MKKFRFVIRYLFFLLIGGVLFWLAFRGQDADAIIQEFKRADYRWAFLSLAAALLSHISRAIRWNYLLSSMGYKTQTSTTFYAVMIGYFANLAVPRIGEITRCGIIAKQNKIPFNKVLGSVVAERGFDLICMFVIMILVAVFQYELLGAFIAKNITGPLGEKFQAGSLSLLIILLAGLLMLATGIWLLFMLRKKETNNTLIRLIRKYISELSDGLKSIWRMKQKYAFMGHTFFIWFMYVLMTWVCFFTLPETSGMSLSDGLVVMIIGSVGIVAPSPGGIGAFQYIVSLALIELYALTSVTALTLANIIFFSQWIFMIALGGFSFLMIFLLTKKNNKKIADHATTDIS